MTTCPHCRATLHYRWFAGRLRRVCPNARCRRVYDLAGVLLGALGADDEMYTREKGMDDV